MIKTPFTKTGDIKYVEVFKIFVLISFFYGLFSRFTSNSISTLSTSSSIISISITTLVVIQLLIAIYADNVELIEILKSFVLKLINLPKVTFKNTNDLLISRVQLFVPIKKRIFLRLNVIRC